MQVHIKTDDDSTSKLHDMAKEEVPQNTLFGIGGPFGAPAQRFYDFDQSIILESGIGVTPFSGILADLQAREDRQRDSIDSSNSRSISTETGSADLDPPKY